MITHDTPAANDAEGRTQLPDGTFLTADGIHESRSGAVMGRPEAEHSAYGLVRDDAQRVTSPLHEREIRGIEERSAPTPGANAPVPER